MTANPYLLSKESFVAQGEWAEEALTRAVVVRRINPDRIAWIW